MQARVLALGFHLGVLAVEFASHERKLPILALTLLVGHVNGFGFALFFALSLPHASESELKSDRVAGSHTKRVSRRAARSQLRQWRLWRATRFCCAIA